MAKPPEIKHRVRIFAETSAEGMGPLMVQLTLMGLENIGYELIEDTISFNKKKNHDQPAEAALTEYVAEHPTFAIRDAIKHFEALGRSKAAIYTAAGVLVEKKILKKLGPGNYSAADVKHIEGPTKKEAKAGKAAKAERKKRYDISNHDLAWNFVKGRKQFKVSEMAAHFAKHKRPTKSVSGVMFNLVRENLLKGLGEGDYLVVKNNKPAEKAKPHKQAAAMNGAAPTVSPTPTNGESTNG